MNYSLNQLLEIIGANKNNIKLKTGDTVNFKLVSGEPVEAEIIGLNHDKLADEKGKARFTFKFTVDGEFEMNDDWTNKGGWRDSKMRNVYAQRFYKMLPAKLRKVIATVEKKTADGDDNNIVITHDKLFCLSKSEVKDESLCYADEGKQYQLFKERGTLNIKRWSWLRSPITGNSTSFWYVYTNGSNNNYHAYNTCGVCFAFAIK